MLADISEIVKIKFFIVVYLVSHCDPLKAHKTSLPMGFSRQEH